MIQVRASAAAGAGARAWRPLLWRCGRFLFSLFCRGARQQCFGQQWGPLVCAGGDGLDVKAVLAAVVFTAFLRRAFARNVLSRGARAAKALPAFGLAGLRNRARVACQRSRMTTDKFQPVKTRKIEILVCLRHAKLARLFARKRGRPVATYIERLHALRDVALASPVELAASAAQ